MDYGEYEMKLKKSLIASVCAAGLLGVSAGAQAILFSFNPNGGGAGTVANAAFLDEAPGNNLALGGSGGGAALPVGTVITDLYQSNLNSINSATNTTLFSNGTGGKFFTFVAGFTETVTFAGAGGGVVSNAFSVNPGGFFKMCAQGAVGNDLAGTGFVCAGAGVLSGTFIEGNATQTEFVTTLKPLDQSPNGDNRPGVQTVTSSGAANLTLQINAVDAGYFPDLLVGSFITISLTNTSNITPFNAVDPSFLFSSNGTAANTPDAIGAINGLSGPNFQFQADANSSFQRTVPEPGTLALLGLVVVGMGGVLSRRGKA